MRRRAEFTVAKPVADQHIPVRQPVESGQELERLLRQIGVADLPDNLAAGVHFDQAGRAVVAARDQGVAVGQPRRAVRSARRLVRPDRRAVGRILRHIAPAVVAHQIVAVGEHPRVTDEGMPACLACWQQRDFFHEFPVRRDLEQASGGTLADEGVAVGKTLHGKNLRLTPILEFHRTVLADLLDAVAGREKDRTSRQDP